MNTITTQITTTVTIPEDIGDFVDTMNHLYDTEALSNWAMAAGVAARWHQPDLDRHAFHRRPADLHPPRRRPD